MAAATQEQLRELALSYAREQLQDPDTLGLHEHAEDAEVELSDDDITELRQIISALKVVYLPLAERNAKAWQTLVTGRWPERKGHMTLGSARAAIAFTGWGGVRGGKILELQDGEWVVIHDIKRGSAPEDLPWRKK